MSGRIVDLTQLSSLQTRRLNSIADGSRCSFTRLIDNISEKYTTNRFWWSTPLASRNVYVSDAFYNACLCIFALEQPVEKYDRLIVPTNGIKKTLRAAGVNCSIKVKKQHYWSYRQAIYSLVTNIRLIEWYMTRKRLFDNYNCVHQSARRKWQDKVVGKACFVVSCPRVLSEFDSGTFSDRYLGEIADLTEESIMYIDKVFYASSRDGKCVAKQVSELDNHIVMEQLVNKEDIEQAMGYYAFCKRVHFDKAFINQIDIAPVLEEDIRKGATNETALYAYIRAAAINNLIEKGCLRIRALIDWYEGQPGSNGMIFELRRAHPELLTVAYTGGPSGSNEIQLSPSKMQVECGAVPEVFAVHGKTWEKMAKQFCSELKCIKAPSFRNNNVFENNPSIVETEKGSIVVILSLYMEESRSLLRSLANVLNTINDSHIYIKNHPGNKSLKLIDYGVKETELNANSITYLNCDALEAVRGKEIAIMTTTTAMLPILLTGVRAIIYSPQSKLSNVYIPKEMQDEINVAYDTDDIAEMIRGGRKPLSQERIEEIREKSYTRANKDTVKKFFDDIIDMIDEKRKGITV